MSRLRAQAFGRNRKVVYGSSSTCGRRISLMEAPTCAYEIGTAAVADGLHSSVFSSCTDLITRL